jgi:hypothetical protein
MAVVAAMMVGLSPSSASAQAKPIAEQIAEAVFALPEADRDGAMVWGWHGEAKVMEASASRATKNGSSRSWHGAGN